MNITEVANSLSNQLIERSITDSLVVAFPGRFQPFHSGHYNTYRKLTKAFPGASIKLSTSSVISKDSPLSYDDRVYIINRMFNIPKSNILKVKSPYNAAELISSPNKTSLVIAVSKKDAARIQIKPDSYYQLYVQGNILEPAAKHGYVYVLDKVDDQLINGKPISGTGIRTLFSADVPIGIKKRTFVSIYGKFDEKVFNLLLKRFSNVSTTNLTEISSVVNNSGGDVDDGPPTFYKDHATFKRVMGARIRELERTTGFSIVDFVLGDDNIPFKYRSDVVDVVSYGGDRDGIRKYVNRIEDIVQVLGWTVVKHLGIENKKLESDLLGADTPEVYVENFLRDLANNQSHAKQILLQAGGAFGHLQHPFEDMNLSFGNIKNLVDLMLSGKLSIDTTVKEKTDGQNILFSWVNGKLVFARNKGHLKDRGARALDANGIRKMFAGRGEIEKAFSSAALQLGKKLNTIDKSTLNDIFQNGARFASMEIIFSATRNVIPYDRDFLVLQHLLEYDVSGKMVGKADEYLKALNSIIDDINSTQKNKFVVIHQPKVNLTKVKNFDQHKSKLINKILSVQKAYNLGDSDTISDYMIVFWKALISKKAEEFKLSLNQDTLNRLINRWVFSDKSYSITNIKQDANSDKFAIWIDGMDKSDLLSTSKRIIKPIEEVILEAGAILLKNALTPLVMNRDAATIEIVDELKSTIKKIESSGSERAIELLKQQVKRLQAIGGESFIVPSEGIVFEYGGSLYKATGTFAPINAILGILRYNR